MENMLVYSSCSKSETTWNKEIKKLKKVLDKQNKSWYNGWAVKNKKENIDNWTVK